MKKLTLTALLSAVMLFTGCSAPFVISEPPVEEDSEQSQSDLMIILGAHGNAFQPDLTMIQEHVLKACRNGSKITLIVDDGEPFVAESFDIPEISQKLSESNQKRQAENYAGQVLSSCQSVKARTAEIDSYKAISLAERCISPENTTDIVILDSLLPTTGKIDFSSVPLFSVDTESSVMDFANVLPNLANANIYVYGIGETAGIQKPLSSEDYQTLCDFWKSFFQTAGSQVSINQQPYSQSIEPDANLPAVSACLVSEDTNQIQEKLEDGIIYELPPEAVSFVPDTAEFADLDRAKEDLTEIAGKIDQKIVLVGMTATYGDAEISEQLSALRAEAVGGLLHEIGVDSEIICLGTGFSKDNPFHVDDLNLDGSLNEELAQKNRTVLAMTEITARNAGLL